MRMDRPGFRTATRRPQSPSARRGGAAPRLMCVGFAGRTSGSLPPSVRLSRPGRAALAFTLRSGGSPVAGRRPRPGPGPNDCAQATSPRRDSPSMAQARRADRPGPLATCMGATRASLK
ncbi:hypothetical protein PVAP13_6KG303406 [Panicum virgatum]|uniref:Uncharacterized protein n=1 Tax=Panicum virgatum TaxID=38727 RepID=A0A8T0RJ82_PANVG|nr:hypothetical protein PVAP13_6KG303406 [Panicum virgatum]